MRKQKITDEQVNKHLNGGMSQRAIADLYNMQPAALSVRIKKMRQAGTLKVEKENPPPRVKIKKMDTVVRLADRRWFRVVEIDNDEAVLRGTHNGEFGGVGNSEKITVSMDKLTREFEKKEYPEVKCYVDPELIKKEEEEDTVKVTPKSRGKEVEREEVPQVEKDTPVGRHELQDGPFQVHREYLRRVDQILDTVGVDRASDKILVQAKQLIAEIIHEGILEEMGFEPDEIAAGADLRR